MRNDVANALDVVHFQIDRAFFVATLLQNEVVRLRLTVEARLEIAEDLAGLRLAVDIEDNVAREHCEHFHPLFGPFQLALVAHLLGDVDDGDIEPRLSLVVHHIAAAVVHPYFGAVGTIQPIGNRVGVAALDLGGYLVGDAPAVIRVDHADKAVVRNGAEFLVGSAAEQLQHVAAHIIDRAAFIVGAIAKQTSGNAIEKFLGHLIFDRTPIMRAELALGHPMKYRHNQPLCASSKRKAASCGSSRLVLSPTIIPPLTHSEAVAATTPSSHVIICCDTEVNGTIYCQSMTNADVSKSAAILARHYRWGAMGAYPF